MNYSHQPPQAIARLETVSFYLQKNFINSGATRIIHIKKHIQNFPKIARIFTKSSSCFPMPYLCQILGSSKQQSLCYSLNIMSILTYLLSSRFALQLDYTSYISTFQ